jgi:hypothetical protein
MNMFSTPLKYYNALSDFYHMLFGFAVLQVASYYIAILAQEHNLLSDVVVRVTFAIIQGIVMLVFETKQHFFQYKIWLLFLWNALLLIFSVQVNPAITFLGLLVLSDPYFRRQEKLFADKIRSAIEVDDRLYFLSKNPRVRNPKSTKVDYDKIGA